MEVVCKLKKEKLLRRIKRDVAEKATAESKKLDSAKMED